MMNVENILKVADDIEQNPAGFDMNRLHACIACRAAAMATGIAYPRIDSVQELAEGFLDLHGRPADDLFLMIPNSFGIHSFADRRAITPEQAVRCLRNLAITGKVDWETAMKPADPVLPPVPVRVKTEPA